MKLFRTLITAALLPIGLLAALTLTVPEVCGQETPNTFIFKYNDNATQAIFVRWKSVITFDKENICLTAGNESFLLPAANILEYSFVYDPAKVTDIAADSDVTIRRDGDRLIVSCKSRDVNTMVTDISGKNLARASAAAGKEAVIDLSTFSTNVLLITVNGKTFKYAVQ